MALQNIKEICFDDIRGMHVLVALSGGADSVALLYLLAQNRETAHLCITAAHFNHRIRGDAAEADAAFCRNICNRLGIRLIEGSADIPQLARDCRAGIETVAREYRHRFLQNARAECGADLIALAHHMDDQAETILMHLLRGAGPEGICGMQRRTNELYRPLLNVRKCDLVAFLKSLGLSWREDASNAVPDTPRNALRLNALPEIEKCYTGSADAIARYGRSAQIESAYVARQTQLFLKSQLQSGPYGKRILLNPLPDEAILRRSIRSACGRSIDADKLEEISLLCRKARGKTQISGDLSVEKTPDALYFLPNRRQKIQPVAFNPDGKNILEGIAGILAEPVSCKILPGNPMVETLDAQAVSGAILRTRQSGDHFHPLGAPGDRLLSDYLTDRKIDRPLRDFLPVLARERRILWIGGVGISETAKLRGDSTCAIRITYEPFTNEQPEVN